MNAQAIDVPAVGSQAPAVAPVPIPAVTPAPAPAAAPAPHVWQPPRKRMGMIATHRAARRGALLAVLAAWNLPPFAGGLEKTDNAYVRGLTMNLAPQVSGYVVAVEVKDYEQVHAGQVLARIEDRIYKARVAAARANLSAQSGRPGERARPAVARARRHGARE